MRRAVLLTVAALPLTACAGTSHISSSVTTTVTATTTVTPSPTASATRSVVPFRLTLPAAASRRDSTGAAATAEYYFQAVDHAFATGQVAPLQAVSTATNRTTTDFAERAGALSREGNHPLGPTQQVAVTAVASRAGRPGTQPVVEVTARYSSPAVAVQTRAGRVDQVAAVPERTVVVTTVWVAGRWLVDAVQDPLVRPVPRGTPGSPGRS